ncbi:MAG: TlpA disulfide reductase family protein [SAR324 cluster bacterium]|nr:TlpA disulfide reductase family protein [SAR324 cluster bacterium]
MARIKSILLAVLAAAVFAGAAQGASDDDGLLLDVAKKPVAAFDFHASLVTGEKVRLSDFRGKVVFLNFWATWCVPCVLEMPSMQRLADKLKGKPFRILAVNMMEKKIQVQRFLKNKVKVSFPIVMDPSGDIAANYSATSLPLTYIIDKKGIIVRRAIGAREWDSPQAVRLMLRLMGEPG